MFNKEQLLVMCNIIAALESEGQVYHTRETATGYGDFTEAYANTSSELAITLGRYQHYGVEALKLLKLIYSKDKSLFTDELVSDMNTANWNYYAISRNSSKAQTIIRIISSPIGKEAQDELVGQQMQEYAKYVEQYGVTDVQAQALAVNWIHQGGKGAFTRILAKTPKPYTLDNFYNASKSDTGNQVGAFKSRQTACYNMIKQYFPTTPQSSVQSQTTYEINPGTSAEDILNIMRGWIGLNQYDGSHMQIVNIYNNHRPLAVNYTLSSTDSWCAATISTAFIVANAVDLIGGTECGVDRMIETCFKPKGIWIEDGTITPQPGDIITFNWDQSYQQNNGFADHIGIVEYVEGGVIHTIEGNAGGRVQRRTYPIADGNIRGFARPKYGTNSSTVKVTEPVVLIEEPTTPEPPSLLRKGDKGSDVVNMQKMLIAVGFDCGGFGADGDFGNDTESSLKDFQKENNLTITGTYTIETKTALERAYDAKVPKKMYCIKKPKTILRTGASKKKPIIKELDVGTEVTYIKSKKNSAGNLWSQVQVDGITGWIVNTALSNRRS